MGGENLRAVREGTVFGKLVVIRYECRSRVLVRCVCGAEAFQQWGNLIRRGATACHSTVACKLESNVRRDEDGCWRWQGYKDSSGYGRIYAGGGKQTGAHRVAWSLANNMPIPDGLFVMHSCDNPSCVNPKHLSVGTHNDNMRDMTTKGRAYRSYGRGSKLSAEQILEIRRSTLSEKLLGLSYGVNRATIGRILRRESWTHIPPEDVGGANGEEII